MLQTVPLPNAQKCTPARLDKTFERQPPEQNQPAAPQHCTTSLQDAQLPRLLEVCSCCIDSVAGMYDMIKHANLSVTLGSELHEHSEYQVDSKTVWPFC